jgi:hypothetical protein
MEINLEQSDESNTLKIGERFAGGRSCFADKRRSERHAFEGVARIAPYDGETFPQESTFSEVECRDISSTGICFLLTRRPQIGSRFLIALIAGEGIPYLDTKVVRVSEGWWNRKRQYVVGGQFVNRVNAP